MNKKNLVAYPKAVMSPMTKVMAKGWILSFTRCHKTAAMGERRMLEVS